MAAVDSHPVQRRSIVDGYLYDKLITPMAGWLEDMIYDLVEDACSILEIGCGPGALALKLSAKCSRITAIDISRTMVEYARLNQKRQGVGNVEFVCMAAAELSSVDWNRFDYAVATFCFHEMEPSQRAEAARLCLARSDMLIIADYSAPFPRSLVGIGNTLLEALAGKNHYRNFRDWQASGGIDGFLESLGLKRIKEIEWRDHCGKTVMAGGPTEGVRSC
jgi:ubiquinone/menaquinone biosynthesis C-methylase UbiE